MLIVGTWLAADKASFINLTLNATNNSVINLADDDAEMILKVIFVIYEEFESLTVWDFSNAVIHVLQLYSNLFSFANPYCV